MVKKKRKGRRISRFVVLIVLTVLIITVSGPGIGNSVEALEREIPEEEGPDTVVTNLTFSKENIREGKNVTIFVTVVNNESVDLSEMPLIGGVNITLMHFEDYLYSWENVSIEANSSRTFEFNWPTKRGAHSFSAVMYLEIPLLNMSLPWSRRSAVLEVDPEPIGNLYSPVVMLLLVFGVIAGAVVAPAFFNRILPIKSDKMHPSFKK